METFFPRARQPSTGIQTREEEGRSNMMEMIGSSQGESSGEVTPKMKRGRGRPPGSKNKRRHENGLTRECDSEMRPYILEVAAGCDVVECLSRFCRRQQTVLSVFAATGFVRDVNLVYVAATAQPSLVSLRGDYEIRSLTGVASDSVSSCSLSVSLVDARHMGLGGKVAALIAVGTVIIRGVSILNPSIHYLNCEGEDDGDANENNSEIDPLASGFMKSENRSASMSRATQNPINSQVQVHSPAMPWSSANAHPIYSTPFSNREAYSSAMDMRAPRS